MVNIALGSTQVSACKDGDANHDGAITIDEILTAVNAALTGTGCAAQPTPTPTVTTLSGTWVGGDPSVTTAKLGVLVFLDESHYLVMDQRPDTSDVFDGFELGTYSWDSPTGAFRALTAIADTNGTGGFFYPNPSGSGFIAQGDGTGTVLVDGDQLTLWGTATPQKVHHFARLKADAAHPQVGTWGTWDPNFNLLGVFVFFDNSHFMLALRDAPDDSGHDGIERGTYTWNPSTGAFQAFAFQADTNGEWGFSNPKGAFTMQVTASTLTIADNDGPHTVSRLP